MYLADISVAMGCMIPLLYHLDLLNACDNELEACMRDVVQLVALLSERDSIGNDGVSSASVTNAMHSAQCLKMHVQLIERECAHKRRSVECKLRVGAWNEQQESSSSNTNATTDSGKGVST